MKNIYIKLFSLALLILIAMSVLLWTQFKSYDLFKDTNTIALKIEHLDEVLTMSARMAAYSGDKSWIDRYNNHVTLLDNVLDEAKQDPQILNQINAISQANDKLVEMELLSFEYIHQGKLEDAQNLLFSPEYKQQKNSYSKGISNIVLYLNSVNERNADALSINYQNSLYLIVALLIVVGAFGIYIVNVLHKYNTNLLDLTDRLNALANTDALTDLFNRRFCDQTVHQQIQSFNRYNTPFSLLMFDVDHFKNVNDELGHDIGDLVLKKIAQLVQEYSRDVDINCRWGGEEFMTIAPNTTIENAVQFAEKIRRKIEEHDFGIKQQVTVSFGVAEYTADKSRHQFLIDVDEALYQAKTSGRNRVQAYSDAL